MFKEVKIDFTLLGNIDYTWEDTEREFYRLFII